MIIPVIIILGSSKMGKSIIYNKLSNINQNLIYKNQFKIKNNNYILYYSNIYYYLLIDTLSINFNNCFKKSYYIEYYLNLLVDDCDIILFLINNDENFIYIDQIISNFLRKINKYIFTIINKIDNKILKDKINYSKFLFFGKPYLISSEHKYNISYFINNILNIFCFNKNCIKKICKFKNINISFIGRINSGKSILINSLINKNKILSIDNYNQKDINYLYIKYKNYYYTFIDTFRLNLIKNFNSSYTKDLIVKIFKIIIISNIILYIIDPLTETSKFDNKIYNFIYNQYISTVFIVNKSDIMDLKEQIYYKNIIIKKLNIKNNYILILSCLQNFNLNFIKIVINKICFFSSINISTNKLNKLILKFKNFVKIYYNYNCKIKYVHQGGKNPLLIIIHSKKQSNIKYCYKKFFKKIFCNEYKLKSIPLKIKF